MGLFTSVIMIVVHLLLICIDLLLFFSLMYWLCCIWRYRWFEVLYCIGKPAIDLFVENLQGIISRISGKIFFKKQLLLIGIFLLIVTRLLLTALFSR